MKIYSNSGQSLLIVVLIGMLLIISIPIVILINQIGSLHQVASEKRVKGRAIAEEGIAYATQLLSQNSTVWTTALPPTGIFPADCNSGNVIPSPSGGKFKINCSVNAATNPGLQPYQVAVTAIAYMQDKQGPLTPIRALKAYLSQRTLGTDLSNGLHAAAALQLLVKPNLPTVTTIPPSLTVHWGPIVCLDDSAPAWDLYDPLDHYTVGGNNIRGFPRKFSQGGLRGTWPSPSLPAFPRAPNTSASNATTDQLEYWAFASQTLPPLIDELAYETQSKAETDFTPAFFPTLNVSGPPLPPDTLACPSGNCGYFKPGVGNVAVFDGTGPGYSTPSPGETVFVEGDAQFDKISIDDATFIITGNLTLGSPGGGAAPMSLHVPATAPLEYPELYWLPSLTPQWPCKGLEGKPGYLCPSNTNPLIPNTNKKINFRGFLYVKGNLTVSPSSNWKLAGSVLVGDMQITTPALNGKLIIPNTSSLFLAYDDLINHKILVTPVYGTSLKVVPDVLEDTSIP